MNANLSCNRQPLARLGNFLKPLCAVALLAAGASAACASDPTGIYAFVDRIVFEPSDSKPERIQVWGGFALAQGARGAQYHDAQRGCLYFKLRAGEEDICQKEWADLKSVAGTGQIVAFGSRYQIDTIKLRKADAKVEQPDVYPKGWGMNKVKQRDYPPINQLLMLQGRKTGAKEPSASPGRSVDRELTPAP